MSDEPQHDEPGPGAEDVPEAEPVPADLPQDARSAVEPAPVNTPGTLAAVVAVAALVVVLFVRTGGGVGGGFAMVLSFFGMSRAVRVDLGLGRSIFALAAGFAAVLYAVLG